jgi:hypothetical protein
MADEDRKEGESRRGERIPGKGFDPGTGYGGAGSDSGYNGESSYGGQSGAGGSTMGGAYQGERYGRSGEDGGDAGEHEDLDTSAFDGREGEFDRDSRLGGERREPGR